MAKRVDEAVTAGHDDGAGAPLPNVSGEDVAAADAAATAAEEQAAAKAAAIADASAGGGASAEDVATGLLLAPTFEPALSGLELSAAVIYPAEPHLIFGVAGEVTHLKPVAVAARDFVLAGDRLRWVGNLEHVAGPEFGPGRAIDAVGLAISADGPVVALCFLSPFTWPAGSAFAFGPGHFVF